MSELEVDPDSLVAAGRVAVRQHGHLGDVRRYIESACDNPGAFTGIMDLFQNDYQRAVSTAKTGMEDAQRVADKVDIAMRVAARSYREADQDAFDRAERLLGELGRYDRYDPDGSGATSPGGPLFPPTGTEQPGEGGVRSATLRGPAGLLPGMAHTAADGAGYDPDQTLDPDDATTDTPGWMNPTETVRDGTVDAVLGNLRRRQYHALRDHGLSHDAAMDELFPNATAAANDHESARNAAEVTQNERDVYQQHREAGEDPDTARTAANDAGDYTQQQHTEMRQERETVERHGHHAWNLYQEARDAYDNVQEAADSVDGIRDNLDDAERYDEYIDSDRDRSAMEWAGR